MKIKKIWRKKEEIKTENFWTQFNENVDKIRNDRYFWYEELIERFELGICDKEETIKHEQKYKITPSYFK